VEPVIPVAAKAKLPCAPFFPACVALLPEPCSQQSKPATAFLLELIAKLQEIGTVPMTDIRAYAHWLAD